MRLNFAAASLRHRLELRVMEEAEIKQALADMKLALAAQRDAALAESFPFTFSEEALAGLDRIERAHRLRENPYADMPGLEPHPGADSLAAVAASISDDGLHRASREARLLVQFDANGRALGIANEFSGDAIMAFIYRAIAFRGAAARLTAEDKDALARDGRTPAEIEAIHHLLRDAAVRETQTSWSLGPEHREIQDALAAARIEPSLANIHVVRRIILLRRANLLDDLAAQPRLDIYGRRGAEAASAPAAVPVPTAGTASSAPSQPAVIAPSVQVNGSPVQGIEPTPTESGQGKKTFMQLVQGFIATQRNIGEHTKRQYLSIGALFCKIAGTNDPRKMGQAHIGHYFDVLAQLPKSYGKSPADAKRTIEEIIARGEEMVIRADRPRKELIGLDPPTIDRHVTQLGAILKYLRAHGYTIGDIETLKDMRQRDPERDEDKRRAFDAPSAIRLFSSAPWNGCGGDARLEVGNIIIHDSLYFVPMLAAYEFLSLSEAVGIMLDDVDVTKDIPAIEIRPNPLRDHVKRPTRTRRQPLHPEIIRLEFRDYVEALRVLGFKTLFPDLVLRGQATDMGDLFDKVWVPALDNALPMARQNKMTLHSFRKAGNSFLITQEPTVSMVTRYQLMGHALKDPNGRHYTEQLPDNVKLAALQLLPNVTAHLKPTKIRLAQAVLDFARDVPVEKRTFLI